MVTRFPFLVDVGDGSGARRGAAEVEVDALVVRLAGLSGRALRAEIAGVLFGHVDLLLLGTMP